MKPHAFHQNLCQLSHLAHPAHTLMNLLADPLACVTRQTRVDASSDHPSLGDLPTEAGDILAELDSSKDSREGLVSLERLFS